MQPGGLPLCTDRPAPARSPDPGEHLRIHAADTREWRNHNVIDPDGHKIGVLEAIYVDTTTDEPAMATVRTGPPTRHRLAFVPVDEVTLGPDYVKVAYAKPLVKRRPRSAWTTYCLPRQRRRSFSTTRCPTRPAQAASVSSPAADGPAPLIRRKRPRLVPFPFLVLLLGLLGRVADYRNLAPDRELLGVAGAGSVPAGGLLRRTARAGAGAAAE